jgi:hypothetical protein
MLEVWQGKAFLSMSFPKTIIITGTREDPFAEQLLNIDRRLALLPEGSLIRVGDSSGIDAYVKKAIDETFTHLRYSEYKANWEKFGNKAGPIRNQEMVDCGADECWAYPNLNGISKGTWNCIHKAKAAGIPVTVYHANVES